MQKGAVCVDDKRRLSNWLLGVVEVSVLRSRWWIAVLVVVAVAVLAAGAVTAALALTHKGPFDTSLPFDRTAWQDRHAKAGVRLRMAEGLVWRHALDGKSRAEVVSMLGASNAADIWPQWDLAYWLGPVGILADGGLVVSFGQDDHVSEVRIVQQPVSPSDEN